MENNTIKIDLQAVREALEREFNIWEYVEQEGEGVLRFDFGSGSSFWLYATTGSVSGEIPFPAKGLKRVLQGFGFTSFDWEP